MNFLKKIFSIEKEYKNYKEYKFITILGKKIELKNNIIIKTAPELRNIDTPNYLSIVAIIKNEAPYIKEWIEYHRLVGVEKFYIYDNKSTDNLKKILKPYIDKNIVVYKYFPGKRKQIKAYIDAIKKYRFKTKWLAIIDADEFIVPMETETIPELLKQFEKYPALGINWVTYDSNGLLNKPDGLVIKNFTRINKNFDYPINRHIKSIVNPRCVNLITTPHFCFYENNEKAVNENFEIIDGAFTKSNSSKRIRINHYFSKSKEEFLEKINRGRADTKEKRDLNDVVDLLCFNETVNTNIMDKYIPFLENKLNNDSYEQKQ